LAGLKTPIAAIQERIAKGIPSLPLAVYFPTNRAVLDIPLRIREKHEFRPLSAYDQALVGGGGNFRLFFEWFRAQEDIENEANAHKNLLDTQKFLTEITAKERSDNTEKKTFVRHSPTHLNAFEFLGVSEDPQLKAVRRAVARLVPSFTQLHVRRLPLRMMVLKKLKGHAEDPSNFQKLEVNQLSDGEKCLLAMAGDLARRLALANPGMPDPLEAEAVVLIDEIELHLHPSWQRRIIEDLTRPFPKCQFIVTTHSPLVLSSVEADNIYLLDGEQATRPSAATFGRDSNAVLSEVMDVTERPRPIMDALEKIAHLIDTEKLKQAREELKSLSTTLGSHDSEIVRLNAFIDFLGEDP
jgi:predicted ATP-binding protein involved in virulence